jgi:hypothetical protein
MNPTLAASPTKTPEHDLPPATRVDERPTQQPTQGGRWWFVFDRWLAVPAAPEDEFVMA